jgi:hypothetical protein
MNGSHFSYLVPLLLAISTPGQGESTADSNLTVAATTPVVAIQPRPGNGKFIRLPTLEYTFKIQASCKLNRKPTSLLLSIADTRKTLDAADISSDPPTELTLKIPAEQIGPIAIEDFCHIADEDVESNDNTRNQLTIYAALSAQASLRCESESDQHVNYVSKTLDVNLVCERPDQAASEELLIDLD